MLRRLLANPIVSRLISSVGTLAGVAVVVFIMLRAIPGNQITASYGIEAAALTDEQRAALLSYYGLDKPLGVQFFSWIGNIFRGNLGVSARAHQSVASLTAQSLPVTLELAIWTIILSLAIGVPLGMLSASKPDSPRDAVGQAVGLAGLSIPAFLLGTALVTVLSKYLGFNPNGAGYAYFTKNPLLNMQQMLLPSLVLAFGIAAPIMRTTRTAILEVRSQDFIRTAKAKGISTRRLQIRHVLGNALVPIVTMTGLQFGYLLGGAVVVEQIFSLPGIGRQVLVGIQQKEYAVVQSTVLLIALGFVIVNLLTDLAYRRIDPRVRAQ
ncbi:MAG: ABC transporter permease [Propionibacteriaceae bacterium]|nr:ABC transporter permease [Propionibacteriaceae bacterium]